MSLKFTGEIAIKNDAKTEQELTCQFKIDVRNLTNFDLRTYIMFELKMYTGIMFDGTKY